MKYFISGVCNRLEQTISFRSVMEIPTPISDLHSIQNIEHELDTMNLGSECHVVLNWRRMEDPE